MFISMGVQMAIETHFGVLATVALYLILCVEVISSSYSRPYLLCAC